MLRLPRVPIFLSPAVVLGVACASGRAGTGETMEPHMYVHFTEVGEIQTAVLQGRLADVAEPAGWLAEHGEAGSFPRASSPHMERLRTAARRAATWADFAGGATSTFAWTGSPGSA